MIVENQLSLWYNVLLYTCFEWHRVRNRGRVYRLPATHSPTVHLGKGAAMSTFIDLTGQTFGRLIVLAREPRAKLSSGRIISSWLCQCECGMQVVIQAIHLRSGHTTSCGCLHRQRVGERSTKHGGTRMPEYRIWCHMRGRCMNPRDAKYPIYGARGITVDPSWLHDFSQFLADMGRRPSPSHTLERRNNNGPYSAENCLWATPAQQSRNTRQNVFLTWDGITLCLTDWAHRLGINETTLRQRLRRWPYDKAFTTPPKRV
jgi:hypothetical protein